MSNKHSGSRKGLKKSMARGWIAPGQGGCVASQGIISLRFVVHTFLVTVAVGGCPCLPCIPQLLEAVKDAVSLQYSGSPVT